MTGLKISLPQAFTDTTLPVLRDDPVLTAGSLSLIEPAHQANPLAAGVPASSGTVPNIAWKEAATVLGTASPTKASLPAVLTYTGAVGTAGSKGIVERTGKGGLHVIVSQAQSLAAGDGALLTLDSTVRSYLAANPTHSYYLSTWGRITRADPTPGLNTAHEMSGIGFSGDSSNYITALHSNGLTYPASNLGAANVPSVAGNFLAAVGRAGSNGTPTANGRAIWAAPAGSYNAAVVGTRNTHWVSWVMYRLYVEDLTISGRTYATVKALDDAAFATATGTGGRYAGDTFTAPSTLA